MTALPSTGRVSLLRQFFWPTAFTLIAGALLIGLGVWQLHRLAWKERLLAEIAARADAPLVALPAADEWPGLKPQDYDYRHVEMSGHFITANTARVFVPAGPEGIGPGYLLLTPLQLASGAYVIVNRGFVPMALAAKLHEEAGAEAMAHVVGLMQPPQARTLFTPKDEPEKNEYFSRDPFVIAAHFHLARVAPFIVDADAVAGATGWPRAGTTERDLPNNHLSYALTWFGLAVGMLGVFVAFVIRKIRENSGN
jgi:surfeit locus 1 family protein